jgi:hypothetical protein
LKNRVLTGKKPKVTKEEKEQILEENQALRDFEEMKLCGDFKLIYPNE